jgi:hypothetical protein
MPQVSFAKTNQNYNTDFTYEGKKCKKQKEFIEYVLECRKITGTAFQTPQNGEFENWNSYDIRYALADCATEAKKIFCNKKED